jgi:hypothetical protein
VFSSAYRCRAAEHEKASFDVLAHSGLREVDTGDQQDGRSASASSAAMLMPASVAATGAVAELGLNLPYRAQSRCPCGRRGLPALGFPGASSGITVSCLI